MPVDMNINELKPLQNFGDGCPGCGVVLAAKLLLQTVDDIILVNSTGSITPFLKSTPFVHAGLNAISIAKGLAHSFERTEKKPKARDAKASSGSKVVVFAGDGATALHLASLLAAKEDILYICANDYGYTSIDHYLGKSFAPLLTGTTYTATACVAHPEDYVAKLKKAAGMSGFRFIEVLCPCPVAWQYEPSNTMEVGRVAVETGIFPLYEIERGTVNLTKRPNRLEPVERFGQVQKKLPLPNQDDINARWKLLTEGRLL